jgi:hypothetical protein
MARAGRREPAGRRARALGAAASLLHSNGDAMDIAVSGGRIAGALLCVDPASELTLTSWDPVSYRPVYKIAAARVEKEA